MYLWVRLIRLAFLIFIFVIVMWALMPSHGSAVVVGAAGGISSELFLNKKFPLDGLRNRK